ncbi:MAG: PAS domain S-box protein [Vicinamibacteria bacterium]|nr:PAS domain S-box protein [Vicinamibacteria bacterium]
MDHRAGWPGTTVVWLKDAAGAYLTADASLGRLLGTGAELVGRTDFDLLDREAAEARRAKDRAAIDAGTALVDEEWGPVPEHGPRLKLATTRTPVRDAGGRLLGVLGVVRDVTSARHAEAVEKQAALLARTSALAHVGGWEFDVESGEGTWTDEVARIHDLDPALPASAQLGLGFFQGVHREAIETAVRLAIEERRGYDLELELISARGVRKWVRTVGQPVVEAGRVTRLEGVFQDVTRRHRAEEALRHSEEVLRQLAENVEEVFRVGDVDTGALLYVSGAYERVWGRSRAELAAAPDAWLAAVHEEDRARVETSLPQQASGGYDVEYRIVRPDGTMRTIHERAFPVRDGNGSTVRIAFVARDVTDERASLDERLRLEERLRHAQKMEAVGRLAGGVAHDFNNMLGVILGHATLAERGLRTGRPVERHVEAIRQAGERSAGLTRQLLQFSRRRPLAAREVDVDEHVAGLAAMLRGLLGEDVALSLVRPSEAWAVRIDPSHLDQVLTNLAVNARDAMYDGGRLTVEVRNVVLDERHCRQHPGARPGEYVLLVVSDTGCGMDADTLSRACEPFFTTKPEGRGTGLGLATVYGIAEQNGGFVHLYSEPGHGTTIRLYLPRHRGDATVVAEAPAQEAAGPGGEVVLLVEDEDALREIAGELLADLGYGVLAARDPEQALELLADPACRVDLLLTDVVMPGLDGRRLAERARALRPGLAVLYASGYTADTIAHRGLLEPGTDFVEKPYTAAVLAERVRSALARR